MPESITIDPAVFARYEVDFDQCGSKAMIELLLELQQPETVSAEMVEASLNETRELFATLPPDDEGEPPVLGSWDWVRVDEGLVFHVSGCDEFAIGLRAFAEGIRRRGAEGMISIWDRQAPGFSVTHAGALTCHIRVRGELISYGHGGYEWGFDHEARRTVMAAGIDWCGEREASGRSTISAGVVQPLDIEIDQHTLGRVEEAVDRPLFASISSGGPGSLRSLFAFGLGGLLELSSAGARTAGPMWRDELAGLLEILRRHADLIAYAFIARNWRRWPGRLGYQMRGFGPVNEPFEDRYGLDAFPVQLLGPGYEGRIPESDLWRATRLGAATLLEPSDWCAWSSGSAPEQAGLPEPAVLESARVALEPILYTDDVRDRQDTG